jgi:hypothetical protein
MSLESMLSNPSQKTMKVRLRRAPVVSSENFLIVFETFRATVRKVAKRTVLMLQIGIKLG